MRQNEELLVKAFEEERPVVLFLGQEAWSSPGRADPILTAMLERLGRADQIARGWPALLDSNPLTAEDIEWLAERFTRNVQSEAMQDLLDLSWSAVFTTSIDARLVRRLETRGRQPEAVLSRGHYARVPRSRSRPPVHYLFGRSDEVTVDARVPRSRMELRQRTVHASDMLNRVAETTTPLGILVLEGFAPGRDWLAVDELLTPISMASGIQILWFGVSAVPDSEFFNELVKKGALYPDERRLVDVVAELKARNFLRTEGGALPEEPGIVSLSNGDFIDISPALRLRVEASAAVVDDTWTSFLPPIQESEQAAFERFHGDLGGSRALVEGIARGFAIRREFEHKLRTRVEVALKKHSESNRAIILHGQSGTGKSVAIARLAYELRKDLKVPVLYSTGRVPQATDLDDFCIEAEQANASVTVILCDCNQAPSRYYDLSNALRSRGRRIVVIGTSYRLESSKEKDASNPDMVEAPPEVSTLERSALATLVKMLGGGSVIPEPKAASKSDNHVLALLYRILSAGRARITAGVSGEARATEEVLRHRARRTPVARVRTMLAEQLIAAGLHDGTISLFEEDEAGAVFGTDSPGRLIDYVMAAGRLNCPVPVSLVMRVLNSRGGLTDLEQIHHLFWDLDLFRWEFADEEGSELCISPRLQLEAELLCRRRLADLGRELDCLIDLIEGVQPKGVDKSAEIRFLLDLLQKLDRNGPRGAAYAEGYLNIAEALTTLRTRHQVRDASLMLQESSFRRAALRFQDNSDKTWVRMDDDKRDRVLNDAREVVELAIREISEGKLWAGRRTKENLYVERASIYGFLAVGRARVTGSPDTVWSDYLAARTAITRAMAIADSYFPFDVGLWTPFDILNESGSALSDERRSEMRADIYAVLDQVDIATLPPSQQEKFNSRRYKLGSGLGDEELGGEAYQRLEASNPPVAYFLRARSMCPGIFGRQAKVPFPEGVRQKAQTAAKFLRERNQAIAADVRCLNLLLQLEWAAATGDRLLHGERRPLPSDSKVRADLLASVRELNRAAGEGARFIFRYLEATLTWVNGDTSRAVELWRALDRETEYEDASRVIRRLFVADVNGKPNLYRGRLEKQRSKGHWQLKVDGWQGYVNLPEREFKNEDLQPGREIRGFAIAFNYLGPIADPASRYGGQS